MVMIATCNFRNSQAVNLQESNNSNRSDLRCSGTLFGLQVLLPLHAALFEAIRSAFVLSQAHFH